MFARLLFGDDIFISYSRSDGSHYATGLADELTKRNFSCFIDQLGAAPDKDLPADLTRKIANSTMCVVVGTPRALNSQFVRREVEQFKKTKRTIIPIYFDTPQPSSLDSVIPGLACASEAEDALARGNPSPPVISHIEKAFSYTRRQQRMRRLALGTVAFVILLIAGASVISTVIYTRAQRGAAILSDQARQAQMDAFTAKDEAKKALADARITIEQSKQNAMRADRAERCCPKCR